MLFVAVSSVRFGADIRHSLRFEIRRLLYARNAGGINFQLVHLIPMCASCMTLIRLHASIQQHPDGFALPFDPSLARPPRSTLSVPLLPPVLLSPDLPAIAELLLPANFPPPPPEAAAAAAALLAPFLLSAASASPTNASCTPAPDRDEVSRKPADAPSVPANA